MRRTIYVILGLISVCFVFAQQTISESVKSKILTLPEFEIKEQKLIVVLDKVIADEEKCPYYSDSVCFVLNIEKNNVIINSINNIRSLPSYRGYFYHQNRFFFVVSRTFPDSLFKIGRTEMSTDGKSYLTTSKEVNADYGNYKVANYLNEKSPIYPKMNVLSHTHNHPGGTKKPSKNDGLNMRNLSLYSPYARFFIYTRKGGYNQYPSKTK